MTTDADAHANADARADAGLLGALKRLLQRLNALPDDVDAELTPLGEHLRAFLGVDPSNLSLVRDHIPAHRLVDADLALERLMGEDPDASVVGIRGGQERNHEDLSGLVRHRYSRFGADGPIEFVTVPTGPRTSRQVVASGIRLLRWREQPIALWQRSSNPQTGRPEAGLELLSPDPAAAAAFVAEVHRLMTELSVLRGQVLTFAGTDYGPGVGGISFLDRPDVTAEQIVLPEGLLDRVRGHVIGIGEQQERLRALGQHLKRGVLLYGPPGTGKTLTVRHLISATAGTTAILLQGSSLRFVGEAARLARVLAPSIVVLEDVDLIAGDRVHAGGPQPLLFEILDALDGLDGDADVAFLLTTNRADMLEPALAARPGRVDLAVAVPLPDAAGRRALLRIHGSALGVSEAALDAAADRAAGTTASFAKELCRRTALRAAAADRDPTDDDLAVSLEDMLGDTEGIAAALFGGGGPPAGEGEGGGTPFGWFAYAPLAAGGGAGDTTLD